MPRNTETETPVTTNAAIRNPPQKKTVAAFSLNHVKNYVGVPLAIAAPGDTDALIEENLVDMTERARAGSIALGLTDTDNDLTDIGETVVETVQSETTLETELSNLQDLRGTSTRFIDAADRYWNPLIRHIARQNSLIGDVATILESTGPVTLPELARVATRNNHPVSEMLLRDPQSDENVEDIPFNSPEVYSGQAVYQFKNLLYHCGVVSERGADTSALVPKQDVWALEPWLIELGGEM